MSSIAQVAKIAGVTTADVHRVLSHGGSTQDDWAIAHAIQAVTGRSAYELMYTAGRDADIATIWADTSAPAETPAPTNPRADHDPTVAIYAENTAPEDTNRIAPHHPSSTTEDEQLRSQAWAAIANITHASRDSIDRIVASWTTTDAVYAGIERIVRTSDHPRARRLYATYVTAA